MGWLAGIAVVLLAGCYGPSPAVGVPCSPEGRCPRGQSCDTTASPPVCTSGPGIDAPPADAAPDAPDTCETSADCDAANPVCDPTTMFCRRCIADAECGTDVCIEYEGTCHNESNTLFVEPGAAGACTRADPCAFTTAISQIANNRRVIAIGDGTYIGAYTIPSNFNANSLTISGTDRDPAGAVITPITSTGIVVAQSTKDILIEGISVTNGPQRGIDNRGLLTLSRVLINGNAQEGLLSNGGSLRLVDSTVTGHTSRGVQIAGGTTEILRCVIELNMNGGLELNNGAFTIESSVFANNGTATNGMGGVRFLNIDSVAPRVFAFNTVANNLAMTSTAAGVQCGAGIALDSSILVDTLSNSCTATYSLFTTTPLTGTGNIMGAPAFVDEAARNYHVMPSSPVRDVANPAALTATDLDGDTRPQGAGRDIGADELPQ